MTRSKWDVDEEQKAVKSRIKDWIRDPAKFAWQTMGLQVTDQQRALLAALSEPGAHVAVRSGHGTGKSTSMALAAIWFACCFPNALIPCTAPTSHQLTDILMYEVGKLVGRMPEYWREGMRITGEGVVCKWGSRIIPRTARKEQPDALQGFHEKHVLFLIDEAPGVPEAIFEVARGALSTPGARALMAGNPTSLSGYFYNVFHNDDSPWKTLCFSCMDSPLVSDVYAKEVASEYGADSDVYRVRVLGEFPMADMSSLIGPEMVQRALDRTWSVFEDLGTAPSIIGVDPAWKGEDRFVIVHRKGVLAEVVNVLRKVDGVYGAQMVGMAQDRFQARATFVDQTGVGASVCDQLKALGRVFTPVAFNERPEEPDRFLNRRAEIWWRMREWLEGEVCLKRHPDWLKDLIGPQYGHNDVGKIWLEGKDLMRKRGVKSPDLGDALALTFTHRVVNPASRMRQEIHSRLQDTWDKRAAMLPGFRG